MHWVAAGLRCVPEHRAAAVVAGDMAVTSAGAQLVPLSQGWDLGWCGQPGSGPAAVEPSAELRWVNVGTGATRERDHVMRGCVVVE